MSVSPSLGEQRQEDPWGLLARQSSQIDELQNWWVQRETLSQKQDGKRLKKTLDIDLASTHMYTKADRQPDRDRL